MTVILGYISEAPNDHNSLLLAADGQVTFHLPHSITNSYEKIFEFNNLLIAFNGETLVFEKFREAIKKIDKGINKIQDLELAINQIFPFNFFDLTIIPLEFSRYCNIIILDTLARKLAHCYTGNVWNSFNGNNKFEFEILESNTLYHFGSKISSLNKLGNEEQAFEIVRTPFSKASVKDIKDFCISEILANKHYGGIGQLYSFYIKDENGIMENGSLNNP